MPAFAGMVWAERFEAHRMPLKRVSLRSGQESVGKSDVDTAEAMTSARPSLKRHVEAFRDIGAEAGRDDDAAANFPLGGVAGPHRVAAGAEKRIGVGWLGFGGVEGVIGVGLEDAGPFGAAAIGLNVDHFLVVARQRQADLAPEIFRGLDVEDVGVGFAGGGIEFSGAQAPAAGNSLVIE